MCNRRKSPLSPVTLTCQSALGPSLSLYHANSATQWIYNELQLTTGHYHLPCLNGKVVLLYLFW